jgi:hypothetical protein
MAGKILTYLAFIALAYWFWSGPYQDWQTESYAEKLERHARTMARCISADEYRAGATGTNSADPEALCAEKYNLYQHNGQWHSYDDVRPSD